MLVEAINEKIGHWQAESIRLSTSAKRMRESGRLDANITESIGALLHYVEEQSKVFDQLLTETPADIAAHSRVGDTQNALAMVQQRLKDALPKS